MSEPENTNEAPVREGDILAGKYRVERVLGVGGMGVVVAALHTELDERVALKFLLPSAAQNPEVVARFSREARAAAKIKSQHVARVIDVGTLDDGTPYIVMEYLQGKDLSDLLLRDERLPVSVAVDYVLQASEAIAEAHAAGFVHRDLKPPNLFLALQSDGTSIIKVLDFGISKAVLSSDEPDGPTRRGALTGPADVFGSPMYMSPEQLKSARDVDGRADIWALGVILYELMSGVSPFDRPTVAETFGSILHEQPVPLRELCPEVPEALERIVMRCLEKDKTKRMAHVAELAKALFPFAPSASRASLDRTSRVLRRAGVQVDSMPPPPLLVVVPDEESNLDVQPQTDRSPPMGAAAQTRTAWDTAALMTPAAPDTRARSGARTTLVVGLLAAALLSGVVGVVAVLKLRAVPTMAVAVQADHFAEGARALGPAVAPSVAAEAPPTAAPTAAETATAAPVVSPSAAPSVVPTVPSVAPGPRGKVRDRWGAPVSGAPATVTPSTPLPPLPGASSAPAKPPKAADPDDFGDRK
jgi:serine/threonine protein kinase